MRKNKKLLLASVAAMGALALGVGATSTFAWYQATNSIGMTSDLDTEALTTAVVKKTVSDSFNATVELTEWDIKTTNLELMTYASGIKYGYVYNDAEVLVASPLSANDSGERAGLQVNNAWTVYKAVVSLGSTTIDNVTYDADAASVLLAGQKFDLDVYAKAYKGSGDANAIANYDVPTRARLYEATATMFNNASSETADTAAKKVTAYNAAKPTDEGGASIELANQVTIVAHTTTYTYYFAMYVDGRTTSGTVNNTAEDPEAGISGAIVAHLR